MSLVKIEDLFTELYPEVIDEITRTDDDEKQEQIDAAEAFVKGFLFKYDLKALFGDTDNEPTVKS